MPGIPVQNVELYRQQARAARAELEVHLPYLASKIGELKAFSDSVRAAADALSDVGGDLGPGDLNSTASDLAEQWRYGIKEMGERIDRMADSVKANMDGYAAFEDAARRSFTPDDPGRWGPR